MDWSAITKHLKESDMIVFFDGTNIRMADSPCYFLIYSPVDSFYSLMSSPPNS